VSVIGVVLALCFMTGARAQAPRELPQRALWVTRFDYRSAEDVRRAIDRCADLGFDTVLFQVRGNATVFYRSKLEPWAEQLGWKDPGFDPLQVAIDRAHERGLGLHAWVNVMPGWWGTKLPAHQEHLYYQRPEWFWYDQHGKRQPLCERFYVSLNPCLPAVRKYLVGIMTEIVGNYAVDGLHLDYLRFPNESPAIPTGSGRDYPRDPGSVSLFTRASGGKPEEHPQAWDAWRSEQVTRLLREIRVAVKRRAPELVLSAAVGADPERALDHFQDVVGWLSEGLLDVVFPMNYTADEELFRKRLGVWRNLGGETHVVLGTMIAQGDVQLRKRQLLQAASEIGAFAAFAYGGLFDSRDDTLEAQNDAARADREQRRALLTPVFQRIANE
jgi:uncharacterized lipoprotein YddW (UPF0748 family)